MRTKAAFHVDYVVDILRPRKKARNASRQHIKAAEVEREVCRQEVLAAIKRITEPKFRALRARQATDVATTLGWARKKVSELLSANPEWFLLIEDLLDSMKRQSEEFAKVASDASKSDRHGRDQALAYKRKWEAAFQAFWLLLRWGRHPPTLSESDLDTDYRNLTGILLEIATGKPPGSVDRACKQVLTLYPNYDPAKLNTYRRSRNWPAL